MHKCRKEMLDMICKTWNLLENGTTVNSTYMLNKTKDMTDDEFFSYIRNILYVPKKHLYFEIELMQREPRFEEVEAAADFVGAKLFDYVAFPHLSPDPSKPIYTVHKIFNGPCNMRRVQQMVNKKNSMPTDISKRDSRTGQVSGDSKSARVSDLEQFALVCHDLPNLIDEYFGPRGGDLVAKPEMLHKISTTGSVSLKDLTLKGSNRVALNTANVVLLGAGIETNLITENGILPRTFEKQYKGARGLSREKTK